MLTRGTLKVRDFEIPYAWTGRGPGVLVCVNGMQQSMASWAPFLKRMSATDYRTVIFDFPNQGRAIALGGIRTLTPHDQADILAAVVEHVSPDRPVALIGGSWGSLIAAGYAAMYPDRVNKLLLCAFQTRPSERLASVATRGRALIRDDRPDELATLFLNEFANRVPATLQVALRSQFRRLRPEQLRQMADSGLLLTGSADLDSMFDLRQIRAETLVINGALDPLIDHAAVADAIGRLPTASLHLEPEAGHFLHLERPEIADLYVRFLSDRCGSAPHGSLSAAM